MIEHTFLHAASEAPLVSPETSSVDLENQKGGNPKPSSTAGVQRTSAVYLNAATLDESSTDPTTASCEQTHQRYQSRSYILACLFKTYQQNVQNEFKTDMAAQLIGGVSGSKYKTRHSLSLAVSKTYLLRHRGHPNLPVPALQTS